MNQLILSHQTALYAFRQFRFYNSWFQVINNIEKRLCKASEDVNKIDTMVSDVNKAWKNKRIEFHIRPKSIPKKSILTLSNNIKCVCPELLLIQMASKLSIENLSLMLMEFAGTYTITPETQQATNVNSKLISFNQSTNYLNKYCNLNKNGHGLHKIAKAITFCAENSASPMESRLYIKLCGPRSLGFYGCKNLKMNAPINVSNKSALIAGQKTIVPDISCIKKKVAIEYDSSQFHENVIRDQKDKRRRDALVNEGWKVHTIIPQQLKNPYTFDVIARNILKDLGQDYRIRCKNFETVRNDAFLRLS